MSATNMDEPPFVQDVDTARERYKDLIEQHDLSPEDVHAIGIGIALNSIHSFQRDHYPEGMEHMIADHETLVDLNNHDPRALSALMLIGYYELMGTANVTTMEERLQAEEGHGVPP